MRKQGRDREALVEFQRAAAIQQSPLATAQIAMAEMALGLWVDAEVHLADALKSSTDPWIRKHAVSLESAMRAIRGHLGTVELWGTPEGAEILLSGKVVGRLPQVSARVPAGDVLLQARADGHAETSRMLRVVPERLIREHVELPLLPKPAGMLPGTSMSGAGSGIEKGPNVATLVDPMASDPPPSTRDGVRDQERPIYRRWWFWTILGAAAVGAGVAAFVLIRDNGNSASCDRPPCTTWE